MKRSVVYTLLSSSTFAEEERADYDYYATPPKASHELCRVETFNKDIWEPACGEGHISEVLKSYGYNVYSTDLIKRGYEDEITDFLKCTNTWNGDIITNPPYEYAYEFINKAIEIVNTGNKIAFLLRIQFLEGKKRREFYKVHPPKVLYVASGRFRPARNGDFDKCGSGAACYAWYVWEKGYTGETVIKWIN